MKAGRLIEVLKKVSPDAEVRCGIGNVPTLMITNLLNLKRIPKYEVKSVLTKPDDDKYCTLLIKRNGGIKMGFKKLSEYDEEIKRIDIILDNFKEYINNYPQEMGIKPTYISMKYLREELKKERDNLEFYKSTQEAFDRCDDSKKGMSIEEFLKELER